MPPRLLIAYVTSEGQTALIANRIADVLRPASIDVTLANLDHEQPDPAGFDAVIIGASVHAGSFQGVARDYVKHYLDHLNRMTSWFYGVSLSEAGDRPPMNHDTAQRVIDEFLHESSWCPRGTRSFGGALKYREYSWLKRQLMKSISNKYGTGDVDTSRDYDYTNWDAVAGFAADVAAMVSSKVSAA